jgi:hypothetical protein
MKRRIYFIFGDMISNVIIGGAAGYVSHALVNESWRAVPAMAAGMVLGSVIAVAASLVFMLFFGDFEIMLPGMFSGMMSGMFIAMVVAMGQIKVLQAAGWGAVIGLGPFAAVYILNSRFNN